MTENNKKQENRVLKAEKRDIFGKALVSARNEGKLPVVVYGAKEKNTPLFVSFGEFQKIWEQVGESTVVDLDVDGKIVPVLIYDVALDPVSGRSVHVDFYAVDMTKKITTNVVVEFIGDAPAVKLGGTLVKVFHEIEVETMPKNLPSEIKVDISSLVTFEDKILIKDIKLGEGVKLLADEEDTVAFVEEAKEEEEEEAPVSIENIERIGEKEKSEKAESESESGDGDGDKKEEGK
ncbi:50S ribosomal protein L25 [Patescibacteria group bacterium]